MQKWIYAQGKHKLVEAQYNIFIVTYDIDDLPTEMSEGFHIHCGNERIGTYSTEEKAEVVLEKIRVFLAKKGTIDEAVFEMPEDK